VRIIAHLGRDKDELEKDGHSLTKRGKEVRNDRLRIALSLRSSYLFSSASIARDAVEILRRSEEEILRGMDSKSDLGLFEN